jgi:2',3'-cyclic-nucleotide 2'-phosphodiesterase (5'-nucleotidase family)
MTFSGLTSLLIGSCIIFTTCSPTQKIQLPPAEFSHADATFFEMNGIIDTDSAYYRIIAPYRSTLAKKMNEPIGKAIDTFTRIKPESSLGNLAAESLRDFASFLLKTHVDLGLVNLGGLRTDLLGGTITIGNIFEVMPFENRLIILEMDGKMMANLLHEIAQINGEPISGARFRIESNQAKDIIINGQPLQDDKIYRIATSDYLANGGGNMPSLWKAKREETNYLIRDIIIEYVRNRRVVEPVIDGRIR